MVVLATVDELVVRSLCIQRTALDLQGKFTQPSWRSFIFSQLNFHGSSITLPKRRQPTVSVPRLIRLFLSYHFADTWVRAVAKSAAQVTALNAGILDGSCHCWVVYVGREPGIYYTMCVSRPLSLLRPPNSFWPSEEADQQIKSCPGQQYRHKGSKSEVLASYTQWFQEGKVEKWVELTDDVVLPRSSKN
jgi:hypothetical protein